MHWGQVFNVRLSLVGTAFCQSINMYPWESHCLGSNPDAAIYNKYD